MVYMLYEELYIHTNINEEKLQICLIIMIIENYVITTKYDLAIKGTSITISMRWRMRWRMWLEFKSPQALIVLLY